MVKSRAGAGCSKPALIKAMAADLEVSFAGSRIPDFGKSFVTIEGGVDIFLAFVFSKLAARALNAGDLPLSRTLSGLNDDTLLER